MHMTEVKKGTVGLVKTERMNSAGIIIVFLPVAASTASLNSLVLSQMNHKIKK